MGKMWVVPRRVDTVTHLQTSVGDANTLRIWIRVQNFGPIWILIQGYDVNFERKKKIKNNSKEKQFSSKMYGIFFKNKMSPKEIFSQ